MILLKQSFGSSFARTSTVISYLKGLYSIKFFSRIICKIPDFNIDSFWPGDKNGFVKVNFYIKKDSLLSFYEPDWSF